MRVGFNLLYLRPGRVGGSEVYARSLLAAMAPLLDTPVTVYCSAEAAATFQPSPRVRLVPVFQGAFTQAKRLFAENWQLRAALRAHPVDVLLSPGNFAPGLLPSRVPQVATVHDLQHVALPANFSLRTRLARAVLFRATFLRCRLLISISDYTRQELLRRYGLAPGRVAAVPLGADFPAPPSTAAVEAARAAHGLTGPYLCYPAMVAPHKNHQVLFRALASLRRAGRPVPLLALTGATDEALARLRPATEAEGVDDLVRPLGYLPRAELQAVIAGATALVYPSRFEGFGLPLLEAMQLGVPVVSSRATSLADVAGDAALLLSPDDDAGWADAIQRVTSEAGLRERLVAAGRANVRRFSWRRCAEETLSVLAAAAARRPAVPDLPGPGGATPGQRHQTVRFT